MKDRGYPDDVSECALEVALDGKRSDPSNEQCPNDKYDLKTGDNGAKQE